MSRSLLETSQHDDVKHGTSLHRGATPGASSREQECRVGDSAVWAQTDSTLDVGRQKQVRGQGERKDVPDGLGQVGAGASLTNLYAIQQQMARF